ncbi:MAG TPA: aminopeptidase P N-terminal domain-containing protein [Longimicrobiaceae bacterium]|nr:aminopeptidase P N-terminal domain-containing protein [Longimicrobiaceae bacterium]
MPLPCRLLPFLLVALGGCAPGATTQTPAPQPREAAPGWAVPATPPAAPIPREEYARRRQAVGATMDDGVLVVFGAAEPENDYLPFAQSPAMRYLTGITEPGAALVMVKSGGAVQPHLFVLPRNPAREVWEGTRLGTGGAQALTGIPARPADRLIPTLDSLLARHRTLYTLSPLAADANESEILRRDEQIVARLAQRHPGTRVTPLDMQVLRVRASKSPAELDLIRRAVHITSLAHRAAMRSVEPGMNEFEIQGLVEYTFRRNGAERPAFATIMGSGPNATTLHYRSADRFMQAGEVMVMDIGASYRGYAADVTRTVPVSGTFSPEQRAVYEIVLAAQKAAESEARPGATLQELSETAARVIAGGLARLGLIESAGATYDCRGEGGSTGECEQYQLFYMHGLGHGIGLDVHDPDVSYFGPFAVGSAFTIEPGIYVRADVLDHLPDTPRNRALIARLRPTVERYRDIGVRIEDDYFITPTGVERVSGGAPREIAEIEALMREQGPGNLERHPEVVEWYRATTPR